MGALTRAATPLLRQGTGRIVHIGSVGGRISSPGIAPYSASNAVLFLSSDEASFVTGVELPVDGGTLAIVGAYQGSPAV